MLQLPDLAADYKQRIRTINDVLLLCSIWLIPIGLVTLIQINIYSQLFIFYISDNLTLIIILNKIYKCLN